jgi:dTDP-4-dehydrorhamnose 3,5-epimerase
MEVVALEVPDVLLVKPKVFGDHRGYFLETFHEERYRAHGIPAATDGRDVRFVQDNVSRSAKGILRGLHLQHPFAQGKLVQCTEGAVFDVAVDVRVGSPHFGRWVGAELSAENHHQLWIPPGFAHGFVVLTDDATFAYKCTELYHPETEISVLWNDPEIGIQWPFEGEPRLSAKDAGASVLSGIDPSRLPRFVA